jgi:T5SS/PEP-CTERM-associated repeat protein
LIGYASSSSSSNLAVVTGAGSVWSNAVDLFVGNDGRNNQLIVINGGSAGGFVSGQPVIMDETTEHPLNMFEFSNDFTGFDMEAVVVQMDNNSTTEWTFVGTEVSRELIAAPACLCE